MPAKSRPILFSGPMVRAIIEGRKSQTRRLVKREHFPIKFHERCPAVGVEAALLEFAKEVESWSPYGGRGDRLWVRETLRLNDGGKWIYAADGEEDAEVSLPNNDPRVPEMIAWAHHQEREVCPSIFMPRWASRLTLEVTRVRVERLEDITEEDAKAEGVPSFLDEHEQSVTYREGFLVGFRAMHKLKATASPWLWVLDFKRVQ